MSDEPRLPIELLERIAGYSDLDGLKSLSLSCKTLLPCARAYIVHGRAFSGRRLHLFLDSLAQSPHLVCFLRGHLTIDIHGARDEAPLVFLDLPANAAKMQLLMGHIESFRFIEASKLRDDTSMGPAMQFDILAQHLAVAQRLRQLRLMECTLTLASLQTAISSLPSLQELKLEHIRTLSSELQTSNDISAPTGRLNVLHIVDVAPPIEEWIVRVISAQRYVYELKCGDHLMRMVRKSGAKHLELVYKGERLSRNYDLPCLNLECLVIRLDVSEKRLELGCNECFDHIRRILGALNPMHVARACAYANIHPACTVNFADIFKLLHELQNPAYARIRTFAVINEPVQGSKLVMQASDIAAILIRAGAEETESGHLRPRIREAYDEVLEEGRRARIFKLALVREPNNWEWDVATWACLRAHIMVVHSQDTDTLHSVVFLLSSPGQVLK